jgi:RsiW-degrading membrane proteinase PrsW (M82 family)
MQIDFPSIEWYYILLSALPFPVFWYFTRFRLRSLLLGVLALFIAYYLELSEEMVIGAGGEILMIVFLAPVVEEIVKFLMTWYRKDVRAGVGVGLGFAMIENAMYYTSLSPIAGLGTLLMFREIQDPILHSSTVSVSVRSWKGIPYVLLSIAMHSVYNIISLSNNLAEMIGISSVYAVVLGYMVYRSRKNKNKIKK